MDERHDLYPHEHNVENSNNIVQIKPVLEQTKPFIKNESGLSNKKEAVIGLAVGTSALVLTGVIADIADNKLFTEASFAAVGTFAFFGVVYTSAPHISDTKLYKKYDFWRTNKRNNQS